MPMKTIDYKGYEVKIIERKNGFNTASIIFEDNKTNSTCRFNSMEDLYNKLDTKIEANKTFKRINLTERIEKLESATIKQYSSNNVVVYKIKSVKGYVFGNKNLSAYTGLGLYNEKLGFVTFDNENPYTPIGGRETLNHLLENGFVGENSHVMPNKNYKIVKDQLVRV
jgi:hypothetical protein